jgi:hypothetical protein
MQLKFYALPPCAVNRLFERYPINIFGRINLRVIAMVIRNALAPSASVAWSKLEGTMPPLATTSREARALRARVLICDQLSSGRAFHVRRLDRASRIGFALATYYQEERAP